MLVGRIVPPYESSGRGSPLDADVEGFYEWVVDEAALRHTPVRPRDEAGAALIRRHEFDEEAYGQHVDKIMERFVNPRLKDDVVRVGREPLRKLSKGDWLLGPTSMALELGLPTDNLSMGIAAAFRYDVPEDKQSVKLQNRVKREGISKVVADLTGFEEGGEEHRKIMDAYKELRFEYMPPN